MISISKITEIFSLRGASIQHVHRCQKLIISLSTCTVIQDVEFKVTITFMLGLAYLKMSILNNFSYFVFDFAGSGLSDGRYISLGYHEVDDVATVLKFLQRNLHENLKIVLWGRSMGAVTGNHPIYLALRYLALNKNPKNIIASVFDSPFHSLR